MKLAYKDHRSQAALLSGVVFVWRAEEVTLSNLGRRLGLGPGLYWAELDTDTNNCNCNRPDQGLSPVETHHL